MDYELLKTISTIQVFSGGGLALAVLVVVLCTAFKWRELFGYFKEIPYFIIGTNTALLFWMIFVLPKDFSGRNFGVWLMSMTNYEGFPEIMGDVRTPVYLWRTKFFSELLGGISYDFLVALNSVTFFLTVFLIYILVYNLTEDKKAAYASSFFYLISPVFILMGVVEEYTLLPIFFLVLSLFFASIQIKTDNNFYLVPALASALLAVGSRVEFIFFPYVFILFYAFFIKKNFRKHLLPFLFFATVLIPRTFLSLFKYFWDAQEDYALHGRTYEYGGDLFYYISQVIIGASDFFFESISESLTTLVNLHNLNGVILFFALFSLVILFNKNSTSLQKRSVIFFLFLFLFLLFYYEYFHAVGGVSAHRYMPVVYTPLLFLAGMGVSKLLGSRPFLFYFFVQLLLFFTVITFIIPATSRDHKHLMIDPQIFHEVYRGSLPFQEEYFKHRELSYENRVSRLFKEDFDVSGGSDVYFISNGTRTYLRVMPVNGVFVSVETPEDWRRVMPNIPSGSKVYISQSSIGLFPEHGISFYRAIDPARFQEKALRDLDLQREILSYEKEGYPIFLYEMKKP